jgi:hypothetical protein
MPDRGELFAAVQESVRSNGLPFRFPPSLLLFVELSDVRQEFWVGVSRRLLKVRTHIPGTGTSPPIGYLLDGGVRAVQDMVRSICNANLLPYCGCNVWSPKNVASCAKCGEKTAHAEIYSSLTDDSSDVRDVYDVARAGPEAIAMARITLGEFETLLQKHNSTRTHDLFKILCGSDPGPCIQCIESCKGAISEFEQRNGKWNSGCINMRAKIADYFGCSTNRVSTIYNQLKKIAKAYGLGIPKDIKGGV